MLFTGAWGVRFIRHRCFPFSSIRPKPESEEAVGEIGKLAKKDANLKIYLVGHTDNVGGLESNMKLSQDRAEAVMQALVKTYGIAASRMKAFGNGPYAPVFTNDNDEGRARNRRVELVKQ